MANNEERPMENVLDGLDQHSGALSMDELKEELRGRGIDIEPFLQRIDEMITEQDKRERLQWMQIADERKTSLRVAETPAVRWIERTREEILAAFAALRSANETAVAFRNKETLSLEDMAEILDAQDRVRQRSSREGSTD
jgi:predicted HTH domain antitoxin